MRTKRLVALVALIVALCFNVAALEAVPVEGDTSATWENPQAPGGDYAGVGTSQFSFGYLSLGYKLNFSGTHFESADIGDGEVFSFGTVDFFNAFPALTSVSAVDLDMTLDFEVPDAGGVPYTHGVGVKIEVFGNDYISLDLPLIQVDPFVIAEREYTIEMLGFDPDSITGNGWYTEYNGCGTSEQRFHVGECSWGGIDLMGVITCEEQGGGPGGNGGVIPEPATLTLMLFGLPLVQALRRKKRRS